MKTELVPPATTIPTATIQPTTIQPATIQPPTISPRRRIRRQLDHNLITGPGPGSLLFFEDPAAIQAIRQSILDRLNCHSAVDLVFVELATSNAWQALRAANFDSATVDAEVAAQREAVDRDFESIDDISRTALIYQSPEITQVLRVFHKTQHDCQRALLQIVRPPTNRTGS